MPKKQSDGRYRAKITIGATADGKPIVKYVSGRTRRELEEAKQTARAHFIDGAVNVQDKLFAEYAVAWYRAKKEPHLSEPSRVGYRNFLNNHVLPAFGNRMLRAIQPFELQEWLNGYAGKSKTTITMVMTILRNVFNSACAEGILQRDPSLALMRPKPAIVEERRAFTAEECAQIEQSIFHHKHGMLFAVLYYLGVRRGEALGLQWGDFDWQNETVQIQRDIDYTHGSRGVVDNLKSAAADRHIPIPEQLFNLLRSKRSLPHLFLFGAAGNSPLSYTTFQRRWMELMIDAGMAVRVEREEDPKAQKKRRPDVRFDWKAEITPHYFRHNYATALYNAGVDPLVAMRLLGHSDYATTAKIYTHLNNMHIKDAAQQLKKVFSKEKVAEKLPD
ncbi:MAG: site-specific integrase [Clostridia bacterium]|nr:site-specific integrase [Clostridia bacterium]